MRIIQSELSKLMSLPSTWIACAAGIITPVDIAVLTSLTWPPDGNTGFSELAIGVVGAIVLGVSAIGSEYTTEGEESASGRQITTSLTVTPRRVHLLAAKAFAVVLAVAVMALIAIVGVMAVVHILLPENGLAWCPASRSWQDFLVLKGGAVRVGLAQVHLLGPVSGDGLVRTDLVVLDAVVLGPFGQHDGVVDLVDEQAFVLQRPEPSLA